MRLLELRRQVLIALGLPACWTTSAPPKPAEPVKNEPAYVVAPKRPEAPLAMFDAKTCTIDTIVETVCGRQNAEYCDGNATRVELANSMEGLYVTTYDAARASAKDWVLDDKASEVYVTRLQSLNEKLEGKPGCCYSRCTPLVIGQAKPLPTPLPAYHRRDEACIPTPPKGTTQPDQTNPSCPQGVQIQNELRPYSSTRNDQCCYASVTRRVMIQKGRPARVEGDPHFADVSSGTAWHADLAVDVSSLPPDQRARLAALWLDAARMEHASVAAFSATSLRLLALGAPPELIAEVHRAALDEIEHARIAFALASKYSDTPLEPGAFDGATKMGAMTLRELAIETFVDGCIGETAAAADAAHEAEVEMDPEVAAVQRRIAIDEERHAELAWSIVEWCVSREPAIADELQGMLAA